MQYFTDRHQRTTKYVKEGEFIRGRELVGFTPWMYELPLVDAPEYAAAWRHALDSNELAGPHGLRTVEPSYPHYMAQYRYDGPTGLPECQWNGPSWPFQNSQTQAGMANLIDDYKQSVVTPDDYLRLLRQYAQQHLAADGHPDFEEDYNPDTGTPNVGLPRSHHYNHSTFNDLVLNGLIGIRPSLDDKLVLKPLIPANSSIRYFALDRLVFHGHNVGIVYDADGARFGVGKGLSVYVDGLRAAGPAPLGDLSIVLPKLKQPAKSAAAHDDLAVNIGEPHGPQPTVSSSVAPGSSAEAIDGRLWFFPENPNGWSPEAGKPSWFAVDFGRSVKVGGMSTQDAQKMENIAKDFKKLESDLKSDDLSAAKQDYVTLKSDLPAASSTSSTDSSSQTNPMDQLLTQLGKDLDSGNISAAQQDFSQIKEQMQNGPQGPPPGAPPTSSNSDNSSSTSSSTSSTGESAIQKLLDQLEKNLKNGDTTSAKETLKTLQEDIANMASSYTQSSSTGSTVNTYA